MDDIQNLFYIAVAIIFFIYKAFSKKETPNQSAQTDKMPQTPLEDEVPSHRTRPATLEDLLEEFGKPTKKTTSPTATQRAEKAGRQLQEDAQKKYKEGKKEIAKKTKALDRTIAEEKRLLRSASEERSQEKVPLYKNEADLVNYEDPKFANYAGLDNRKEHFAPFEKAVAQPTIFAQMLRNPQSARTAFIMSEILKRKY